MADPVGGRGEGGGGGVRRAEALRRSAGADRRPAVDAVVIVSPTHTHKDLVIAAASAEEADLLREAAGDCRWTSAVDMQEAIASSGMFFQMGFMRRFDAGLCRGEEADRGGADRRCRWCSSRRRAIRSARASSTPTRRAAAACCSTWGSTTSISRAGSWARCGRCRRSARRIAYPELATVGDIDNAVASLTFASGKLGVVDLSRSGIYGYDISHRDSGHWKGRCRSATCVRRR